LPSFGGTSVALVSSLLDGRVRRRGLELVTRYSSRELPRRRQDLPSSWGTSIVHLPCSNPTPAGLLAPDHYSAATWPLVIPRQGLPREGFRRSIAWPSDSLSTLRTRGLPRHHARLASGCWSGATGRGFHPQGSDERFPSCISTSHPPFPSFAWRKESDRGRIRTIRKVPRLCTPPLVS
jgi:hypothetical protein